jgi:hypothetical protein
MTAGPVERPVSAPEAAWRAAAMALGQRYGHGDSASLPSSARREAADRAVVELDQADLQREGFHAPAKAWGGFWTR